MLIETKSPASGATLYFNMYRESCCAIGDADLNDFRETIWEFEREKLDALWTTFAEVVTEDGATFLEGFRSRPSRGHSQGNSPEYFSADFLRSVLGVDLRGTELCNYLQGLTIEGQEYVLEVCYPKSYQSIEESLRDKRKFPFDKEDLISWHPNNFLEKFTNLISSDETSPIVKYDSYNFLLKLWAKGLIVLPTSILSWSVTSKWKAILDVAPQVNETLKQIYTSTNADYADRRIAYAATFFAMSTAKSKGDLTPELIRTFDETVEQYIVKEQSLADFSGKTKLGQLSDSRKAVLSLVGAYNSVNPEDKIDVKAWATPVDDAKLRKDLTYRWLTAKAPELAAWSEHFYLFLISRSNARINVDINGLNHLANFLMSLESPPLKPWLMERRLHVYDPRLLIDNTFLNYLKKNTSNYISTQALNAARRFFLWLRDYLIDNHQDQESRFPDPILEDDSLGTRDYKSKTYRDALPHSLISEMKSILVEDDFAFPKTLQYNTVLTTDQETGYAERVFCPGLAICMYALLDTPIRSHQARWLDSGLMDEYSYDFSTGEYGRNTSPYAAKGRQEGILRVSSDALRSEKWLAMWVNTSKNPRSTGESDGYSIPYISPEFVSLIETQLDWSQRYLPPLPAPLNYRYHMQEVREIREGMEFVGPMVAPLFRDPSLPAQDVPFSYPKLTKLYVSLLVETEKRFAEKYNHKVKLTNPDKNGQRHWAVDLHSLRVSGITNLIEAGVPIEVVQQFVAGHRTLVMTLHYLKYTPEKLRGFIQEANRRMQEDKDFVGSQTFLDSLSEALPFLLGQDGAATGAGFEALNSGDGIIVINNDGICPGTSCSSGYVVRDSKNPAYGPVPGGKRCPLCRYWLTGPAHLLGQVTGMNNLAFTIRKKGFEIRRLNDLEADALDVGNRQAARDLRDRVDLLNRELDVDVAEWTSRHHYVMQSIALMDDYLAAKHQIIATDAKPKASMVTPSAPLELKVTLEQAHEFALLDQITQLADFNPGFPNLHAELEKHQMLSKVMVANGIKPFLVSLTDEQAREAGNLLSALMLQQVKSHDLDEVLTGKKPLSDYPYLSKVITELEQASSEGSNFIPRAMNSISNLIAPPQQSAPNNEDTFG
jgi:hypothetical protein